MKIIQWQVPLLVMAVMIVAELGFERVRRSKSLRAQIRFRTGSLAFLAVLVLVIGMIAALGPSLADQLASVAAAIAGFAALWLTYQSYRALQATAPPAAAPPADAPPAAAPPADAPPGAAPPADAPPTGAAPAPDDAPPAGSQPIVLPADDRATVPPQGGAPQTILRKPPRSRWRRRFR